MLKDRAYIKVFGNFCMSFKKPLFTVSSMYNIVQSILFGFMSILSQDFLFDKLNYLNVSSVEEIERDHLQLKPCSIQPEFCGLYNVCNW